MYPKISLIFFFALVIIIHGKDKENAKENANNNAAPCTDETNFGKDRYCMLEYGRYANKTALLCDYPGATYYGVAKVLVSIASQVTVHDQMCVHLHIQILFTELQIRQLLFYIPQRSGCNNDSRGR